MQLGVTYYIVSTTYSSGVTAAFTLVISGPEQVNITRVIVPEPVPLVRCLGFLNDPICPIQLARSGTVRTHNPNRILNGGSFAVNKLFFNLEDPMTVNAYVRIVKIQYGQGRYPSSTAQIWIYGIVPVGGSYIVCSQYPIPASQISTTQAEQTYTIPNNVINLFNGSYVGIGIQDSLAAVATTYNGFVLYVNGADQTTNVATRESLYFQPDGNRIGVKLTYTTVN
ncbi:unnamed protein product [Rotaria sordida]|nr:unnamed protein product [Rotaria sordida]CAF1175321.1 unnamed protein product [Rotaria sordida]CAF1241434.1 unnamed protein product [Rotaria sordida]CAF1268812.1 unnamed protein product [Rotaria sordida]CAF1523514.1 unnamed protein product [Rotaria sordida]